MTVSHLSGGKRSEYSIRACIGLLSSYKMSYCHRVFGLTVQTFNESNGRYVALNILCTGLQIAFSVLPQGLQEQALVRTVYSQFSLTFFCFVFLFCFPWAYHLTHFPSVPDYVLRSPVVLLIVSPFVLRPWVFLGFLFCLVNVFVVFAWCSPTCSCLKYYYYYYYFPCALFFSITTCDTPAVNPCFKPDLFLSNMVHQSEHVWFNSIAQ